MKTMRSSLFIILLSAIMGLQLQAEDEFTKKVSKSFDVNKDATLSVKNKFGKVHCENWDKNSISIEVTITVQASSQEKANKYFDKIKIDITGTNSLVTAITSMEDNIFGKGNNELSVDYMINMPKTVNVELNNKFGDIIVAEVGGTSNINLGYGTIDIKKLSGSSNDLDIEFSDGYIGYIKSANLDLKYSELKVDEIADMTAESKFSELNIGKIDVLTLETGYDEDFIGSVRNIDVEADFSDVEIRIVEQTLTANFDYGELKVKEMGKAFKLVDITNSFSDANIGFNPEASYRINATVKMGDLSYPQDRAKLSVVEMSYTSSKYEGLIGGNTDTQSKVMIDSQNSGVTLYYR
jgi:hypothetical protein